MTRRGRLRLLLTLVAILGCSSLAQARPIFGPKEFRRERRAPQEFTEVFALRGAASEFKVIVNNGFPDGSHRVSSAWVHVNGEQVLGPSDLNQHVSELRRPVTLASNNQLRVRIAGAPGGVMTISVSAVVGAAGGFAASPSGARVTVHPGLLSDEIVVGLEDADLSDTGISLPSGYAFVGAVSLDLDGAALAAEVDVALAAPVPTGGRVIVARLLQLGSMARLALVDTASVGADGHLHTDSPPFPGVRAGGTYVFAEMPPGLGIMGASVLSDGVGVERASVEALMTAAARDATGEAVGQSLASLTIFVGQTDASGFAAIPGILPGSTLALVALQSDGGGPSLGTLSAATVPELPDIAADGFVGAWLQNLVLDSLGIDPDGLPDAAPQCPCSLLQIDPASIPTPPDVFTPHDTRQLHVYCSPSEPDVTESDADTLAVLTTGLASHVTGYHPAPAGAGIVTVSPAGLVTAVRPGAGHIYAWTHFVQLFKATVAGHSVVTPYQCFAAGGVDPVAVAARLGVATVGTGAGTVQSAPAGIVCPATCDATFDAGTVVSLTATPAAGSVFVGWNGDCSGTAASASITMDDSKTCAAVFDVQPLAIVTDSPLPNGTAGTPYSASFAATGGVPPYTWSLSSGGLPAGLGLDLLSGVISGTPLSATLSSFTVRVVDAAVAPASVEKAFTLQVVNGACTGRTVRLGLMGGPYPYQSFDLVSPQGMASVTRQGLSFSAEYAAPCDLRVLVQTVGPATGSGIGVIRYELVGNGTIVETSSRCVAAAPGYPVDAWPRLGCVAGVFPVFGKVDTFYSSGIYNVRAQSVGLGTSAEFEMTLRIGP